MRSYLCIKDLFKHTSTHNTMASTTRVGQVNHGMVTTPARIKRSMQVINLLMNQTCKVDQKSMAIMQMHSIVSMYVLSPSHYPSASFRPGCGPFQQITPHHSCGYASLRATGDAPGAD
jgi:hypothetical protein